MKNDKAIGLKTVLKGAAVTAAILAIVVTAGLAVLTQDRFWY